MTEAVKGASGSLGPRLRDVSATRSCCFIPFTRLSVNNRQHIPSALTDRHGLQMVMAPVLLFASRCVRCCGVRGPDIRHRL